MRLLSFASMARRDLSHPEDCQCSDEDISFDEKQKIPNLPRKGKEEQVSDSSDEEDSQTFMVLRSCYKTISMTRSGI